MTPSKCTLVLQEWGGSLIALILSREMLESILSIAYLGSHVSGFSCITDKLNLCMSVVRAVYGNMNNLYFTLEKYWTRYN